MHATAWRAVDALRIQTAAKVQGFHDQCIVLCTLSTSTSFHTMAADLPPSSRVTGLMFLAAAAAIMRPTSVLPVNEI